MKFASRRKNAPPTHRASRDEFTFCADKDLKPGLTLLPGTAKDQAPVRGQAPKANWTILLYTASNDDLAGEMLRNIWDIEENSGSTPKMNLLSDRIAPPDYRPHDYGLKTISHFHYLTRQDENSEPSPLIAEDDRIKVNSPQHLEKSLKLAMKKYPAENYLIILSGHGSGFTGVLRDREDKSYMPLKAAAGAFKNAEKAAGVDKSRVILGFDACLMGQAEAAYEFKDTAAFYLASPSVTGVSGWPFHQIMKTPDLENFTQREMLEHIVEENRDRIAVTKTIAAYDLSKMSGVKEGMDQLAGAVLADKTEKEALKTALRASQVYQRAAGVAEANIDLGDFCRRITASKQIKDKNVKKAARALAQTLKATVVSEAHYASRFPDATGISVYPACQSRNFAVYYPNHDLYKNTAVGRETRWAEAMEFLLR